MPKSDKELTVDIVTTFVESWFASNRTQVMQADALQNLIESVYETIHSLPEGK